MNQFYADSNSYADNGVFKPLTPRFYPPKYKTYIELETQLLTHELAGAGNVLEAGIGIGRLIPDIAPLVDEFVGVDSEPDMLRISRRAAAQYDNVRTIACRLEELSQCFAEGYFEYSLCLWNTLGNVDNEVLVLQQLRAVSLKSIFVTVFKKGTIDEKKQWYETVGVPIERIDTAAEIFYTGNGLQSRAYAMNDIQHIAKQAGLQVISSESLNDVMWWVELAAWG